MNHLAETLRDRLILKGGMLLRLLESPRSTQDLDYVMVSKESKKILVKPIEAALNQIENLKIRKTNLNSRGIFIEVENASEGTQGLIEISVIPKPFLPPEPFSTVSLSKKHSLSGRIVTGMSLPEAFSHKIAASLERNLARDLYDLSQMEPLGPFDENTLKARLSQISIEREKPKSMSVGEAVMQMKKRLEDLTVKKIEEEIYPLLPPEYRPGLLQIIRASVSRIIQRLEVLAAKK